jgi:hypothetical protein
MVSHFEIPKIGGHKLCSPILSNRMMLKNFSLQFSKIICLVCFPAAAGVPSYYLRPPVGIPLFISRRGLVFDPPTPSKKTITLYPNGVLETQNYQFLFRKIRLMENSNLQVNYKCQLLQDCNECILIFVQMPQV